MTHRAEDTLLTPAGAGLSSEQQYLLTCLLRQDRADDEALRECVDFLMAKPHLIRHFVHVRWRPSKAHAPGTWTRSDSASLSRSLRRLERRGLVERIALGRCRTTSVRLTDTGRATAEELLAICDVNRSISNDICRY